MAHTVQSTLQLPYEYIRAHAEMKGSDTPRGMQQCALALNTLYAHKKFCGVLDGGAAALRSLVGARTFHHACKTPVGKFDGVDAPNTYEWDVWLYMRRQIAYPTSDWQIRVRNTTSGASNTVQVNGGAVSASYSWWNHGQLATSDDVTPGAATEGFNQFEIDVTTATGVSATSDVRAVAIFPTTNESALPSMSGGYVNAGGGDYTYPFDTNYVGAAEHFASAHHMQWMGRMAVDIWQRRAAGMIMSKSWTLMGITTPGVSEVVSVFGMYVPPGVTQCEFLMRNNSGGASANVSIDFQGAEPVKTGTVKAASPDVIGVNLERGGFRTVKISSDQQLSQISGWLIDATY